MAKAQLHLSGDPGANKLLSTNSFALLVGMVLDQQIPLEWAFTAPSLLQARIGGRLNPHAVAESDPAVLASHFRERPALHRYPASMAERVRQLSRIIVDEYGGDPARIWKTAKSGTELLARIEALPGFGKQKAKIFVALLGKQLGITPPGWQEASAPFGEAGSRLSIADIDSPETLAAVREHKREIKAANKRRHSEKAAPKKAATRKPATKKPATKKPATRTVGANGAGAAKAGTKEAAAGKRPPKATAPAR